MRASRDCGRHEHARTQTGIIGQAGLPFYCFARTPLAQRPRHWKTPRKPSRPPRECSVERTLNRDRRHLPSTSSRLIARDTHHNGYHLSCDNCGHSWSQATRRKGYHLSGDSCGHGWSQETRQNGYHLSGDRYGHGWSAANGGTEKTQNSNNFGPSSVRWSQNRAKSNKSKRRQWYFIPSWLDQFGLWIVT